MDNWTKTTLIILSIQILGMSLLINRLLYKNGYLEGRASVYAEFGQHDDDGTPYTKKDK